METYEISFMCPFLEHCQFEKFGTAYQILFPCVVSCVISIWSLQLASSLKMYFYFQNFTHFKDLRLPLSIINFN